MLDEKKCEPAKQRDLQTGNGRRRIQSGDQPSQRIIDNYRSNNCQDISANAVCPLDVSHRAGVKIEPFLPKDGVPAPADELVYNNQDPNGEMINVVHDSP